jgi:S1-C subfamily serine protease
MSRNWITLLATGLTTIAVACGGGDESTPTATPTAAVALTSTATASPATASAGNGAMSPDAVYAAVSPAIAFVETSIGTGSAILLDERRLITNSHVVWPFEQVRVVFPDGTEFLDAPVVAFDLMTDLAIIELPAGHGIQPVGFGDPSRFPVGTELFLIGYPGEGEAYPQPTISRGVLSRFREWPQADVTYVQTDAAIAGGQSGGALVSNAGLVVGLSGFSFADAAFGLALSGPDVQARIELLSSGVVADTASDRALPTVAKINSMKLTLENYYDERAFVIPKASGPAVSISVTSTEDIFFVVTDAWGDTIVEVDDTLDGEEFALLDTDVGAPFIIRVGQFGITPVTLVIESSAPLASLGDQDDARLLQRGTTYVGSMDNPADLDYFEIDLAEGERVTIAVDTVMFDPEVRIDVVDNPDAELARDDDSGGGPFGLNSLLEFTAPETARYLVIVNDVYVTETGAYYLVVD